MRKEFSKRSTLLLIFITLLTLGLIGCPDINPDIDDITGTLNINIDDNYTYRVYIDDKLMGTTDWNGDITLYNVPVGYHNIHVQSTEVPYYCIGDTDIIINPGVNNVVISVFCII